MLTEPDVTLEAFRKRVRDALDNKVLRETMENDGRSWSGATQDLIKHENYPQWRRQAAKTRQHVLENLDTYLIEFERNSTAAGAEVLWCDSAADAQTTVTEIVKKHQGASVVKSKSMMTEEIHLRDAFAREGITVTETDLGEYIVQLANEPPSHVVGPASHKSIAEVQELFLEHHTELPHDRPLNSQALVEESRQVLRDEYSASTIGITGANFLIADSGTVVTVTAEGNAELTVLSSDVHIVVTGVERVVPTLEQAMPLLRALCRASGSGDIVSYISFVRGARRAGDLDGPKKLYIVLLDLQRTALLGTKAESLLRCVRCGACMNHCPVYQVGGGHVYGTVYPGPLGKALLPFTYGNEKLGYLASASAGCKRCDTVCPVEIPLTSLMEESKRDAFERGVGSWPKRKAMSLYSWLCTRPRAFHFAERSFVRLTRLLGGKGRQLRRFLGPWSKGRDLKVHDSRTFLSQYKASKR